MAARDGSYLIVAALDFGTTFSGYAFSFRDDPEKIICNNNWGEALGFRSHKTPTSVLTNGAGEFITMGYEAEHKYNTQIEDEGSSSDLHLYRHFKMLLQKSKDVSLKAGIMSEDGNIRPAVEIFGYAIGFLRQHMLQEIKSKTVNEFDPSEILWVITVPAIWSEQSKKFMREAAKRGECVTDANAKNLILALEPEAASMCCRRPVIAGYRGQEGITFPPGIKYLVLDCGGGTVDITAHQTLESDKIEEIFPASGGPWGGIYVDRQFSNLLDDVFGKDFLNKYKSAFPQGWVQFLSSFETVKKPFNGTEALNVNVPFSFHEFHSKTKEGKKVKDSIEQFGNSDVSFTNGMIVLKHDVAKGLFTQVFSEITTHVKDLLKNPKLSHCRYIFMAGGLSENRYLQEEIKHKFGSNGTKVLVPAEAQLAVVKGAVLFGHFPMEITVRIARQTYGYSGTALFDDKIHDESKMFITECVKRCKHIFKTLVKQGESVTIGREITATKMPLSTSQQGITIMLYRIDGQPQLPVQYTDAPEVEYVGQVIIPFEQSDSREQNTIKQIFTLGSTEINIHSIHLASGKEYSTCIDFLSDLPK